MPNRKKAVIKITLMSDLCVGSGYSYAGIIDSDVCYDEYGIPYIPAKRIRGCLREAYEDVFDDKKAEAIFGKGGEKRSGDLVIDNANIADYEALCSAIRIRSKDESNKCKECYSAQNILSQFTHVLSQTKMDKGVAVDNSLRYTRVVNKYSPLSDKVEPLVFEAAVGYSIDNEQDIINAVKALRHIGLKRNRGFGNVRCELTAIENDKAGESISLGNISDGENENCCITYRITALQPLMLSRISENISEDYIAGTHILGAVASKFLSGDNGRANTQEFKDLFLNGSVRYTNAYPTDGETIYYPAPLYINSLKKTKMIVNMLRFNNDQEDEQYRIDGNGNNPKKMLGKFIDIKGDHVDVIEVEKDVVYHNSHRNKNEAGDQGLLYSMEVVNKNQMFEGRIFCPKKYVSLIMELLNCGDYYFGKSKSSQYGKCSIEIVDDSKYEDDNALKVDANKKIVVTFQSDAIFIGENEYTVYSDDVIKLVAEDLGIEDKYLADKAYLETTTSTGYMGVWNLRKPVVPAISKGSSIVYELSEAFSLQRNQFIGERNVDGYGSVRIDLLDSMQDRYGEAKDASYIKVQTEEIDVSILKPVMEKIILTKWLDKRRCDYLSSIKGNKNVNSSALGRITLMLKESISENANIDGEDERDEKIRRDFQNRIDSIKTDSLKSYANEQYRKARAISKEQDDTDEVKELIQLGFTQQEIDKKLDASWKDYLMTVLVELKYRAAGKEA